MKEKWVLWAAIACLLLINGVTLVVIVRDQSEIARLRQQLAAVGNSAVPTETTGLPPGQNPTAIQEAQEAARAAVQAGDLARLKEILDQHPTILNKRVASSSANLLHSAAHRAQPAVVEELLRRNADVNALNAGGYTPLHDCVSKGTEEIAVMLLNRGADVTIRNKAGLTPLQLAKVRNRPEMEELLRKHGARE